MTTAKPTADHKARIRQELIKAGVSRYGLLKSEARHLPEFIHPNEHIEAVIYGIKESYSAMLVATNLRVIYLDRKPLFSAIDEITYEMVAGVAQNSRGNRAAVTLHTRVGEYAFKFVNLKAASRFVKYIEKRRVEHANGTVESAAQAQPKETANELALPLTDEGTAFLHNNQVATLSSIDRQGNVHGAVIYYFVDANNTIYILTKADTHKTHNVLANSRIALTVYDASKAQTLQLQGETQIEPDAGVRDFVFKQLSLPRKYNDKVDLPPVTKLDKGAFIVLRIKPLSAELHDYIIRLVLES